MNMRAATDLMLLHPDGSEEVLVAGGKGADRRPLRLLRRPVGLLLPLPRPARGATAAADIYKVHVKTRKVVRLTQQQLTPEHRRRRLVEDYRTPEGQATEPYASTTCAPARCRAAGSSSSATATASSRRAAAPACALQLFVMDDDGANVEKIGHLNIGQALHPVILKDGRIIFSSLESRGYATTPAGASGASTPTAPTGTRSSAPSLAAAAIPFHFQTQLSDEQHRRRELLQPGHGRLRHLLQAARRGRRTGTPPFGPAQAAATTRRWP